MAYSALFWFVVLYLLSAYLRLYPQEGWQHNRRLQAGACLAAGVLLCLSVVVIDLLSLRYPALASHATDFKKENSIFVFVLSVSLFLLFLHRRPFVNRWINQLALSMLGVYLLHENELLYPTMFQDWLNGPKWLASPWLAVHALLSVAAIFAAGVVIDQLRIFLLERPLFSLLDRGLEYVDVYKMDGTLMFRVEMGYNVACSNDHENNLYVQDFDGDGKSELILKTALGTQIGNWSEDAQTVVYPRRALQPVHVL